MKVERKKRDPLLTHVYLSDHSKFPEPTLDGPIKCERVNVLGGVDKTRLAYRSTFRVGYLPHSLPRRILNRSERYLTTSPLTPLMLTLSATNPSHPRGNILPSVSRGHNYLELRSKMRWRHESWVRVHKRRRGLLLIGRSSRLDYLSGSGPFH